MMTDAAISCSVVVRVVWWCYGERLREIGDEVVEIEGWLGTGMKSCKKN
jgi:hypothetical protein